jgi:myo-inositol-1(or 4)-monophosphatase
MTDNLLKRHLAVATRIAHEAGGLVMRYYHDGVESQSKGGDARDLVTEADLASEKLICGSLRAAFPGHLIVGEEGYRVAEQRDQDRPTWFVDPIDGTSNFAHSFPFFSVSIALRHREQGQVGVVHAPALGWTFAAARGQGATLNGDTIQVSPRGQIEKSIIACDWARLPDLRRLSLEAHATFHGRAHTTRTLGSAALGFAAVAAGWIDVYFSYSLAPWDTAAGDLLVREAGGVVSALDGGEWKIEDSGVLASNRAIHAAAAGVLRQHLPEEA